jgi:Domain of unknown function (DUF4349)
MPLLDHDILGPLLRQAGDSFAVPETGIADTLRLVRQGDAERATQPRAPRDLGRPERTGVRKIGQAVGSHRLLSMAAALIALAVITGGAVVWGEAPPSVRHSSALTALPDTPVRAHANANAGAGLALPFAANAPSYAATTTGKSPATAAPTAGDTLQNGTVSQPVRIEQRGSLTLLVDHGAFSATVATLASLATASGGFVSGSHTQAEQSAANGSVTVQIPESGFSALLTSDQTLGRPSALTTTSSNVTGHYVDLQNRLGVLLDSRQQYLALKTSTFAVGPLLSEQSTLDSLQSQITRLQGQLDALAEKTAYSTLTVTVKEVGAAHRR